MEMGDEDSVEGWEEGAKRVEVGEATGVGEAWMGAAV